MGKDPKQAKRAAEKRRKRDKRVREARARTRAAQGGTGGKQRLARARDLPLEECIISKGWKDRGLAHILIARRSADDSLLVGGYYVDPWCLGLKDTAIIPDVTLEDYHGRVKNSVFHDDVDFEPCKPGMARALVEGAITFAEQFGFRPNKRWKDSARLFDGIESKPRGLRFGYDGKPRLVLRSRENLKGALNRLRRTLEPDQYEVVEETEERN